jgi:hypothetical protein
MSQHQWMNQFRFADLAAVAHIHQHRTARPDSVPKSTPIAYLRLLMSTSD